MKITETIMKFWAKISSLVNVGGAIYGIYLSFSFMGLYFDSQEMFYKFLALGEYMPKTMSLGITIFWVFYGLVSVIFGLIFYSPFFYYGWVKNPDNDDMKFYAQLVSIIMVVCFILGLISAWGLDYTSKDFWYINLYILWLVPLYYFAWRKK